jgi:non-homologous end joining protein Ku
MCWSIDVVPRAHWKGFLKLSLVSCPIALYPAVVASERISFRQVNKQTGNRLRQQLVDAITREPVQAHNKGRGYEVGENQFLLVGDEELEAAEKEGRSRPYSSVRAKTAVQHDEQHQPANVQTPGRLFATSPMKNIPRRQDEPVATPVEPQSSDPTASLAQTVPPPTPIENNRTIEIDRFIPRAQIDTRYLNTPYYVVPRDKVGEEAFAVIRDAMRAKDVVGVGRVVIARRERPIIVEPMGNGLRGITLRYNHEIRDEADYLAEIPTLKLPDEMLRVAEHIVETKMSDFDPVFLEDRYRTVLIAKLKEKRAELPKKAVPAAPSAQNVISLMDILKKSLAAEQPLARTPPSKQAMRRRTAPSRSSTSKRSSARPRKAG